MPKNGIIGQVRDFMPQSSGDIELDIESFCKLVRKVQDERISNKERKQPRFPSIQNASPRQTLASPKMSRISFSK